MDYHFVSPEEPKSQIPDTRRLATIVKKISPLLVVSAILPVFLFFLYNPPETTFTPRANVKPELRVWFKPNSIVIKEGESYEVEVYASLDNKDGFVIKGLSFELEPSKGVAVDDLMYEFDTPFSGQHKIGNVSLIAELSGMQSVNIVEDSVQIDPKLSELDIKTNPLDVTVE